MTSRWQAFSPFWTKRDATGLLIPLCPFECQLAIAAPDTGIPQSDCIVITVQCCVSTPASKSTSIGTECYIGGVRIQCVSFRFSLCSPETASHNRTVPSPHSLPLAIVLRIGAERYARYRRLAYALLDSQPMFACNCIPQIVQSLSSVSTGNRSAIWD